MTIQQIDDIIRIYNRISIKDLVQRRLWAAHVYAKHTQGIKFKTAYAALSKRLGKLSLEDEYNKDILFARGLISDEMQIDNKVKKFALRQLIWRSLIRFDQRPRIEELKIQKMLFGKLKSMK